MNIREANLTDLDSIEEIYNDEQDRHKELRHLGEK